MLGNDPDFVAHPRRHHSSPPAHRVVDERNTSAHSMVDKRKFENYVSEKVTSIPINECKTAASKLADCLLQRVSNTPGQLDAEIVDHRDQSSCVAVGKEGLVKPPRDGGLGGLGDMCPRVSVDSSEWFGLDRDEDLEDFEHFDDEIDL